MRRKKLIIMMLGFSACTSIIKKPEVFAIRKLAIISVQSNQGIYNLNAAENGFVWSPTTLFSKKNTNSADRPQIPVVNGFKLANFSLNIFEEEIRKIRTWQLVPAIKVVNTDPYKKFYKNHLKAPKRFIASEEVRDWISPQGMISLGRSKDFLRDSETMSALKAITEELGLDAIVIVSLDLAYAPDQSSDTERRSQNAYASVASSIKVIAKNGTIVVSTPEVENGSGERHFSDLSSASLGRQLNFNDEIESMYKAAIQKSAADLSQKIIKEL